MLEKTFFVLERFPINENTDFQQDGVVTRTHLRVVRDDDESSLKGKTFFKPPSPLTAVRNDDVQRLPRSSSSSP